MDQDQNINKVLLLGKEPSRHRHKIDELNTRGTCFYNFLPNPQHLGLSFYVYVMKASFYKNQVKFVTI